MSNDNIQNELDNTEQSQNDINSSNIFDNNFLLLLIILFVFFKNNKIFSEHFNFLNDNVKQVKNYLDMADATLQALDQASKIPQQMLE